MKRSVATLAAMLLALSMLAGPAAARQHHVGPPQHGHMLILGAQIEVIDGPAGVGPYAVGWRKCIDMPVVPNAAHHRNVHTGQAGIALERAGHAFVPVAPLAPWENCAHFETFLPLPLFDPNG